MLSASVKLLYSSEKVKLPYYILGQPKVNTPFSKFMKRPQTKVHVDISSHYRVTAVPKSKKVKIFLQQIFSLYRYFVKATTTHTDVFLQV